MSADSVPSSKTTIFQSKLIYCRHFRTYSRCAMFDWSDTVFRRRIVMRRRISNTVLQPRYWGRETDSPEVCRLCVHVRPPLTIFVFTLHEMSIEMNNLIDFNPRTKFWYLFSCLLYFIVKKYFQRNCCLFSKFLSEYQWYVYLCIDLGKVEFSV